MLRPFLLIGVGGSGGKTLRVIREDLERRLDQAGWTGPFPDAWQLLHIDVPTTADGNDPDLPPQLPESDYQGLIGSGIDYRTVDDSLVQQTGGKNRDALVGWRPNPESVTIPASKGAGQFRALGRVITLAKLSTVASALREARRALTGATIVHQLQDITRALGGRERTIADDPQVIVVGSIAGGSGSGAIVDVCDVVRSLADKWANESVGILYCPDVFDDLDEGLRRGVRPNSLAALSEIMSGYWSTDGPSTSMSDLYQAAGISTGSSRRIGPRYPFLVGAANDAVTHKTQNDVYRAMGRSIAAWVTSASLQDRLTAYTQAQWAATAQSVTDNLRLHPGGTETPFTALGSARVGLGRDRFRDYASRHLARSVVDLALERHEKLRGRGDERPARHLIDEQAQHGLPQFVREAGLAELGPNENQILDGLQDGESLSRAVNAAATHVLDDVRRSRVKGFTTDDLRQAIRHAIGNQRGEFTATQRAVRNDRARTWVASVQSSLLNATAAATARHGAPVAIAMLARLDGELGEVEAELRHEADNYHSWANDLDRLLDLSDTKSVTEAELEDSVKQAAGVLEYAQEAEARELALQLIPPLRRDLLAPLRESLEHGVESLVNEARGGVDGRGSIVSGWPEGDVVPRALRPTPNEFLLESFDKFPQILADLVRRTIQASTPGAARSAAERQVLVSGSLDDAAQRLFVLQQAWVPQLHEVFGSDTPSRAEVSTALRADEILSRAVSWIRQDSTAIGNYLNQGLREYLDPATSSPKENAGRVAAFSGALVAALNAGAPLVSINSAVLTRVHNRPPAHSLQFSEIPLPEKSPGRAELVRVLSARGQYTPSVEKAFTDGEAQFIDLFTVLAEPYEPVVFDSLMRPIQSDWGAKRGSAFDREEFWRWRRARPLPEAVPLHPRTLQAMVRGWFIAGLLDQTRADPVGVFVPASAQSGGSARFVDFETPLLRGTARGPEALPDVLESLPLALLRVNDEESLTPMLPYHRLLDLGEGAADELPDELQEWISKGKRAQGSDPDRRTAADRLAAASDKVETLARRFDQHFDKMEARHDILGFPGSYDLRNQIRAALGDLYRALEAHDPNEEVWN